MTHVFDPTKDSQGLYAAQQRCRTMSLADHFAHDPSRAQRWTLEAAGLFCDYSKHLLDDAALQALCHAAEQAGLQEAIPQLFQPNELNVTEGRAVQHVALRQRCDAGASSITVAMHEVRDRMRYMVSQLWSGEWRGVSGEPITDVVNIGVGGSDHGPAMACKALRDADQRKLRCHFVANMDGEQIKHVLSTLRPQTTLFVIVSKSFTTLETRVNTEKAMAWLGTMSPDKAALLAAHCVAVTAKPEKAEALGVPAANIFPLWDSIGGRYSLWSAVGLSLALQIGMPAFEQLLAGAAAMDDHFRGAPLHQNMPVILALISVWYRNFWHAQTEAVIPYCDRLSLLPAYLQQLQMESLGKSVDMHGQSISHQTGAILWGGAGSVSQHTFHQFLLQSRTLVPVDFILPFVSGGVGESFADDAQVVANCLSQARLLMTGYTLKQAQADLLACGMAEQEAIQLAPHKVILGNKPSTLLSMQSLNPTSLGALLALYEHKVFVQATLWGINAFDQWAVERGKRSADQLFAALLQGQVPSDIDVATQQAAQRFLKLNQMDAEHA